MTHLAVALQRPYKAGLKEGLREGIIRPLKGTHDRSNQRFIPLSAAKDAMDAAYGSQWHINVHKAAHITGAENLRC
jgi:hypothetical protein